MWCTALCGGFNDRFGQQILLNKTVLTGFLYCVWAPGQLGEMLYGGDQKGVGQFRGQLSADNS